MAYVNNKALYYQQFLRRENGTRHHKYDEELQMYNMIRDGNMDAVKVAKNLFLSELSGHLSDTPLKNYKYLFILHRKPLSEIFLYDFSRKESLKDTPHPDFGCGV